MFLRCPLVSAALPVAFAWQAWHLVHCQGVGCTPWRPSGVPWSPPLCRWLLRGRRGTWCTAKGSDVRPGVPPLVSAALPVAFAWQARHLVHCQGVGCTPWRPSGVPWSPPLCRWLLRGRRGTWCTAKGSAVRPGVGCTPWRPSGVSWSPPLCRWLLRGRKYIVSAQVMMLVYGAWTTDMPRSKKFCGATG